MKRLGPLILVSVICAGVAVAGFPRVRHAVARVRGAIVERVAAPRGGPVLLDPAQGIDFVNEGHFSRRQDRTLLWSGAYFGIRGRMDWSGYDTLEVTLFNTSHQVIPFAFEVKDRASDSYWTRANIPQVLGPGLQVVKLPTRLRAGEPGRPGRPLDASHVTSVILSREDQSPIEVRRIELKKSPVASDPGILAWDVGPEDTALFDGFQALTDKTKYDPQRGWGWLETKFWTPYPQANRLLGPERLTADNLTIASAKFRVDLKPGKYRVWMILDHPGGFWGEFPYFQRRQVSAQGRPVIVEQQTSKQSMDRYFEWEDAEDREGEDLFERYWSRILPEKTFETRVENGRLELEFENEGCPAKVSCFGLALSALAILPIDTDEERAASERWLKRVHEARRQEFRSQYQSSSTARTTLLGALPPGLQVRNVSPDLELNRVDATPVAEGPVRISAFRNSRALFAPVVSWKSSKAETLSWRIEGLPAEIPVEGGWVRFRALRESMAGNLYAIKERWVTDTKEREFAAEDLGRLWLRLPIATQVKPGIYPATLVIFPKGSPGEARRLPFELKVFKTAAAELDFPLGPFMGRIQENWWDRSLLSARLEVLEQRSLARMRSLGLTTFSFSPEIRIRFGGGEPALDTHRVDQMMSVAKRLGFHALVGYDNVFAGENLCVKDPRSAIADAGRFKRVVDALERRAREHDWLPLTLIVCDEPVGSGVAALVDRLQGLPLTDGPAGKGARRIQWSVTTSLGNHSTPEDQRLVHMVSLPFLQVFSKSDLKFPWGYYNDASRKSVGLGLLDLRESSDLRYRLLWAWNVNLGNPFFAFDGREDDFAWCASTQSAQLRCTVELDRVIDQGVTDYRIALALRAAIGREQERGHGSDPRVAEAKALLEEARAAKVDPTEWRAKVGECLERL